MRRIQPTHFIGAIQEFHSKIMLKRIMLASMMFPNPLMMNGAKKP